MPYTDFDIDSLAAYLHLTPPQVAKLADRGRLPGRKVAGQWRFSKPDIHHWLETRIGLSDEDELVEVEQTLGRNAPTDTEQRISIADMLPVHAIALPLLAKTRYSVISAMTELAAATGLLWDPKAMAEAVRVRENMHPTALENGVALMHPRRPMAKILSEPFLALGITPNSIPFGTNVPMTNVFFLICSTDDRGHLQTLARLSRLLTLPEFLSSLHQSADAAAVHQLIVETEQQL